MSIHHSKAHGEWLYNSDWLSKKERKNLSILGSRLQNEPPGFVFRDNKSEWDLFKKVVKYHKPQDLTEELSLPGGTTDVLKEFFEESMHFSGHSNFNTEKISRLFDFIEVYKLKKEKRKDDWVQMHLGQFIAEYGSYTVYMTASAHSNLEDYSAILDATDTSAGIIKVYGESKYSLYDRYGFKRLKEVPLVQDEDHDYSVPYNVHISHQNSNNSYPN